ncbi:right-handed parallel beta-helix repeat-containing protein [Phenylobacterium sp.]|uniref:right-handed parallel beta-helix repeat-containing protein n=1 Tax=Phenylobacterium sp. TaxID=1871053 RepID=UPI00272F0409|nr:right-handed parallel beta-helix repeat-containing protein [Phenylobacterium sp.]MDP1599029.1 right-handed parallel beta-helix repeat-containing protein [Phenylobacterium sp.]MDP3590457.1 right-handed parallel beta-helix repeat-containing protein [Phenylobacterium sp.]
MSDLLAEPASFASKMLSAVAGDVIRLSPGVYPLARVKNGLRAARGGVITVTAADPASPPRFTEGFNMDGWVDVNLVGLDFDITSASAKHAQAVVVTGGRGLSFIGGRIVGRRTSDDRWGYGIGAGDVTGLTIKGMEGRDLRRGFIIGNCNDVEILENDLSSLGSDAIDIGSCERVMIARNLLSDFNPTGSDHPDGIQVMAPTGSKVCRDVSIVDNLIRAGTGRRPQGIFIKAENGERHQGVTVARNLVINAAYHAVCVTDADGVQVRDNEALFQQGAESKPDKSWVQVDNAEGVATGNRAMLVAVNTPARGEGNVAIPPATQAEVDAAATKWEAKFRPPPGAPPEIPAPTRDELREILGGRTEAKLEPLKRSGRLIVNFATPAQGVAALAAVLAVGPLN